MEILFFIAIAIIGLIIGSFLNVVIYRLPIILQQQWRQQCHEFLQQPAEKNISTLSLCLPRSFCPACQHRLSWKENIPLLSFLWQKGKCRYCATKISWRYPVVEIFSALIAMIVINHFGVSWQTPAALIFSWTLIVLFFIDLEHQFLPDEITLGLLWLGLLLSLFHIFTTPENAIIGAVSGYLFFWILGWTFKKLLKLEALGYGDYKLLAALCAWLGWPALLPIVLIASLLGIIVGLTLFFTKKIQFRTHLPFATFLTIAALLVLLYSDLINFYLSFH